MMPVLLLLKYSLVILKTNTRSITSFLSFQIVVTHSLKLYKVQSWKTEIQ